MATTALKFDTKRLTALGVSLGQFDGQTLGEVVVSSINDVIEPVYELARGRMSAGINLDDTYIRRQMELEKATRGKPTAVITALGDKPNLALLRRFDARLVTVPRTSSRPSKNQQKAGVPIGQKSRAVTVEVARGSPQSLPYAFMLPLKRGKEAGGNGLGVFARRKDGTLKHRYGPSVYQLFSYQLAGALVGDSEDLLAQELATQAVTALQKAIE